MWATLGRVRKAREPSQTVGLLFGRAPVQPQRVRRLMADGHGLEDADKHPDYQDREEDKADYGAED